MKKTLPKIGQAIKYRLASFVDYNDGVVTGISADGTVFYVKSEVFSHDTTLDGGSDFIVV